VASKIINNNKIIIKNEVNMKSRSDDKSKATATNQSESLNHYNDGMGIVSDPAPKTATYDRGMGVVPDPLARTPLGFFEHLNHNEQQLILDKLSLKDVLLLRRVSKACDKMVLKTPIYDVPVKGEHRSVTSSYHHMFKSKLFGLALKRSDERRALAVAEDLYLDEMAIYVDAEIKYKRKRKACDKCTDVTMCITCTSGYGAIGTGIAWCVLTSKETASSAALAGTGYSAAGLFATALVGMGVFAATSGLPVRMPDHPRRARPDLNSINNHLLENADCLREFAIAQRANRPGR